MVTGKDIQYERKIKYLEDCLEVQKEINKDYVDSVETLKAFVRKCMDKQPCTYSEMEDLLEL